MGLRICLINPPIREWAEPNVPPMGLLLLSSVLRAHGHEVVLYDINGRRDNRDSVEEWIRVRRFDLWGTTGLITQWNYIRWCTGVIKKYHPDSVVVSGGPAVSNSPKLFAERMESVDALAVGEGERIVLDIVRDVEEKRLTASREVSIVEQPLDAETRNGLVRRNESIRKPVYQADKLEDMDRLPDLDYENLETRGVYLRNPVGAMNKRKWIDGRAGADARNLCLVSTRSCVFRCRFCQPRYLGDKPRIQGPSTICNAVERLVERFGVTYVHFCDELTFFSRGLAVKFAREMIQRGLHRRVTYGAPTRIDTLDDSGFQLLRESGCIHVSLGIESLSRAVLRRMDKFQTLKDGVEGVVRGIRIARRHIPDVDTSFIIGYPGETPDTIRETIANMRRVDDDFRPNVVFFATPYPGTWLWDYALRHGFIQDPIRHVESLGENSKQILMNFTDIPLEELREWKRRMESASLEAVSPPFPSDNYAGMSFSYPT